MRRRSNGRTFVILVVIALIYMYARRNPNPPPDAVADPADSSAAMDREVTPAVPVQERDGLAAAILIDVSGSMKDPAGGQPKIVSARRAAVDLVNQFARYAEDHKTEPVMLGIFEFSRRNGEPDCREVVPMGPPDRTRAAAAIDKMAAEGGTPIGNAMIAGKRALDATGLSRRHLLVVTDGDNRDGPGPEVVVKAIARRPQSEQPSMYFVAFDISASRFNAVRNAGGLVLEATNAKTLNDTLDTLLRGKILIER